MLEGKPRKGFRRRVRLRKYELHLLTRADAQLAPGLRADADPVEPGRWIDGSVGLDRDLEAASMQRVQQRPVDLQNRLASGRDQVAVIRPVCPFGFDCVDRKSK